MFLVMNIIKIIYQSSGKKLTTQEGSQICVIKYSTEYQITAQIFLLCRRNMVSVKELTFKKRNLNIPCKTSQALYAFKYFVIHGLFSVNTVSIGTMLQVKIYYHTHYLLKTVSRMWKRICKYI